MFLRGKLAGPAECSRMYSGLRYTCCCQSTDDFWTDFDRFLDIFLDRCLDRCLDRLLDNDWTVFRTDYWTVF